MCVRIKCFVKWISVVDNSKIIGSLSEISNENVCNNNGIPNIGQKMERRKYISFISPHPPPPLLSQTKLKGYSLRLGTNCSICLLEKEIENVCKNNRITNVERGNRSAIVAFLLPPPPIPHKIKRWFLKTWNFRPYFSFGKKISKNQDLIVCLFYGYKLYEWSSSVPGSKSAFFEDFLKII